MHALETRATAERIARLCLGDGASLERRQPVDECGREYHHMQQMQQIFPIVFQGVGVPVLLVLSPVEDAKGQGAAAIVVSALCLTASGIEQPVVYLSNSEGMTNRTAL